MNIQKRALLFILLVGATTYVIIAEIVFQSWDRYLVPKVAKVRTLTVTGNYHVDDLQGRVNNVSNGFVINVTDTNGALRKQNG